MEHVLEPVAAHTQQATCPVHGPRRTFEFKGPWFRFDEAAAYVRVLHRCGCPNAKGFYDWRKSRSVQTRDGHLVAKADLDRVMRERVRS